LGITIYLYVLAAQSKYRHWQKFCIANFFFKITAAEMEAVSYAISISTFILLIILDITEGFDSNSNFISNHSKAVWYDMIKGAAYTRH
jgi:hypothetical protein